MVGYLSKFRVRTAEEELGIKSILLRFQGHLLLFLT